MPSFDHFVNTYLEKYVHPDKDTGFTLQEKEELRGIIKEFRRIHSHPLENPSFYKQTRGAELLTDLYRIIREVPVELGIYHGILRTFDAIGILQEDDGLGKVLEHVRDALQMGQEKPNSKIRAIDLVEDITSLGGPERG